MFYVRNTKFIVDIICVHKYSQKFFNEKNILVYPTRLTTKQPHRGNIIKTPIQNFTTYRIWKLEESAKILRQNFLSLSPLFVCTLYFDLKSAAAAAVLTTQI